MRSLAVQRLLVCAFALGASAPALAQPEIDSRGELGLEGRVFYPDDTSRTDAGNVAATGRLQVDLDADALAAKARVFSRLDPYDQVRTRLVPEDVWLQAELEPMRLRVGYQMLNWSATEAFHPADVINSRMLDGNFQNPEKLGEPMAALRVDIPHGNIEAFFMPVFTAPVLPSSRARLNFAGAGTALGGARVLQRDGQVDVSRWQPQWAAQIQQTWGDADVALHVLQQIDRSAPLIMIAPDFTPHPVYQALTQLGMTYQHVLDRTLLKLEAAYRRYDRSVPAPTPLFRAPKRDHVLAAIGVEQGLDAVNGAELSLLLEGQVLIPTVDKFPSTQKPLFEHDVLLGLRHAWNDEASSALLVTTIIDVKDPERLIFDASFNRRLGEVWGATLGLRLLRYPPKNRDAKVLYENLDDAHQLYTNVTRYF
jgi:hypothetical protein